MHAKSAFIPVFFSCRSDTDSGRSSDHGELEVQRNKPAQPVAPINYGITISGHDLEQARYFGSTANLRVKRAEPPVPAGDAKFRSLPRPTESSKLEPARNYATIGYSKSIRAAESGDPKKLHVVRRRHNEALRKRNDSRRNTIDVTMVEVKMAEVQQRQEMMGRLHRLIPSKSTNQLNLLDDGGNDFQRKLDEMSFNATSMPSEDLEGRHFELF